METWSAHQLLEAALPKLGARAARALVDYSRGLSRNNVAVVFSLRHLSRICAVDYRLLHQSVDRRREGANYRIFSISKRSGGRRFIHSPTPDLLRVQQFINQEILQKVRPHPASFAFHPAGGIRRCALQHCRAKFIFHFDLADFFYSVDEVRVYDTFISLGYRPLLSFEMARLCTTTHLPRETRDSVERWFDRKPYSSTKELPYSHHWGKVGVLPQGAPTSPMLGNLAALGLDVDLAEFADLKHLVYTRYADDLTLSAHQYPSAKSISEISSGVIRIVQSHGFSVNKKKTRIARAGSRKMVLGLLVDGEQPRVPQWTVTRIDRFFHAIEKFGLVSVARHHGFESGLGFYNHLQGLVAYLNDVDPRRWTDFNARLREVAVPWDACSVDL